MLATRNMNTAPSLSRRFLNTIDLAFSLPFLNFKLFEGGRILTPVTVWVKYSTKTEESQDIALLLFMAVTMLVEILVTLLRLEMFRYHASYILHVCQRRKRYDSSDLRGKFRDFHIPPSKPVKNHTHGLEASLRSTANNAAKTFAVLNSHKPYYVQLSRSDQRRGSEGSRNYFWVKDTHIVPKPDRRKDVSKTMDILVDVDYYLNMPHYLTGLNPVMMYTLTPSRAASSKGGVSYKFNPNQEIEYHVSGGSTYSHHLWNYSFDSLRVDHYGWDRYFSGPICRFLGIITKSVGYHIDARKICDDHSLILLTPTSTHGPLTAWLYAHVCAAPSLERLQPVQGINPSWTRLDLQGPDELVISVARENSYTSANVHVEDFDKLKHVSINSKHGLTPASAAMAMNATTKGISTDAHIMTTYLKEVEDPKSELVLVGPEPDYEPSKVFTFVDPDTDYDVDTFEAKMKPYMNPFVDSAFLGSKTKTNSDVTIQRRVKNVRSDKQATSIVRTAMHEFVNRIRPDGNTKLVPCHIDEVYAKQHRPTQRIILEQAQNQGRQHNPEANAFAKSEPYPRPKPVRNITIVDPGEKYESSQFQYTLSKHLKNFDFHGSGKCPRELAERVAQICYHADKSVILTDFDKMDGRVSPVCRELELFLMLELFAEGFHKTITSLSENSQNVKIRTREGVTYNSGTGRMSGDPTTSNFNEIVNAFTNFLAGYFEFKSWDKAWDNLGVYCGDDGLTSDLSKNSIIGAASAMGQVVTVQILHRGELGVNFLSRYYGQGVWKGDPNSCMDLKRLNKLHVTTRLSSNVTPIEILIERARSYLVSDGDTPLIGPFCRKVTEFAGATKIELSEEDLRKVISYNSFTFDPTDQYPNVRANWMLEYLFDAYASIDLDLFHRWLASTENIYDMLRMPQLVIPPPVAPDEHKVIVIDHDTVIPNSESEQDGEKQKEKTETSRTKSQTKGAKRAGNQKRVQRETPTKSGKKKTRKSAGKKNSKHVSNKSKPDESDQKRTDHLPNSGPRSPSNENGGQGPTHKDTSSKDVVTRRQLGGDGRQRKASLHVDASRHGSSPHDSNQRSSSSATSPRDKTVSPTALGKDHPGSEPAAGGVDRSSERPVRSTANSASGRDKGKGEIHSEPVT